MVGGLDGDEVTYSKAGYSLITLKDMWMTLEHPPLVKYFIGVGGLLFGPTSFGVRLPVALFGLATIYMTYRVGKLLGNRFTGFVSGFLLGTTFLFAQFSVMAMLDVPLAFFSITLLFVTLKYLKSDNKLSRKYSFIIGFLSILAVTSKYYGIFFAIIPLGYLLLERWREYGLSYRLLMSLNYYLTGSLLSFILVYFPYIFLDTPAVGNLISIFREAFIRDFDQLAGGNLIMVGATVYQYPPFWSYLYWLWEEGGWIYTFGLLISSCYVVYEAIESKRRAQSILLISFILVPLLCFSLMTVKFPHYIIPSLPIFAVCVIIYLYKLLCLVASKLSPLRSYPSLFAGIAVLMLLLIPTTPSLTSVKHHHIAMDSGYDRAAKIVEQYARENAGRQIVVVSWYASDLEYYLYERKENPPNNIEIVNLLYEDENLKIEGMINEGRVDLVVDYDPNLRFSGTHLYQIIREKAKFTERIDLDARDLVVFRF
jgi:4-amino-4-deoxy-L-arabinose transferase-like glycosyltransferase